MGLDELIQGNESSVSLLIASVCCVMFGYGMILFFATGQTVSTSGNAAIPTAAGHGRLGDDAERRRADRQFVFGPTADALESVTTVIAIQAGLLRWRCDSVDATRGVNDGSGGRRSQLRWSALRFDHRLFLRPFGSFRSIPRDARCAGGRLALQTTGSPDTIKRR